MTIRLGTALRCNEEPRHIWIVLSDPAAHAGRFLFVSLTTLRPSSIDTACVLDRPDYGLLSHATTVAYSRAVEGNAAALGQAIARSRFSILPPVPEATLRRIVEGARVSPQLARAKKAPLPPPG